MILGEIPGLALDRSGIALLGAIAVLASGRLTLDEAVLAADVHTLALLFGLMVVSAQFRLGGFYAETVRRIAAHSGGTWRTHARAGIPVTLVTMAIAGAWLWMRS